MKTAVLFALFIGAMMVKIPTADALDLPRPGDRAVPCRPTVACTADLASPGMTELEGGALFASQGARRNEESFPFLAKLTFSRSTQFQIGSTGYTFLHGQSSWRFFDDLVVGPKFHLLDQSSKTPSMAFSAETNIPTAQDQSGYLRAYDVLFTLYVSRDFGVIHADFNAGVDWLRITGSSRNQEFVALTLTYTLSPRWAVEAESYYFSDALPLGARNAGYGAAMTYTLKPWAIFDFGGDVGLVPSTEIYKAYAGFSVVPAVLWR